MDNVAMRKKIVDILCEALSIDESKITDDAHLKDDLGADSLDGVELIMALEEAFGVSIPDEESEKIQKVEDIYSCLESALGLS